LRVWVCWQSLQVEYTGSFLVFNRACLLASACLIRAIPAFGPVYMYIYVLSNFFLKDSRNCIWKDAVKLAAVKM
jgi:hypothetical protein